MINDFQAKSSLIDRSLDVYVGPWGKQALVYAVTFLVAFIVAVFATFWVGLPDSVVVPIVVLIVLLSLLILPIAFSLLSPVLMSSKLEKAVETSSFQEIGEGKISEVDVRRPRENTSRISARSKSPEQRANAIHSVNSEDYSFVHDSTVRLPSLVGRSPAMRKVFSVIERVAPTDASVLITGQTGTGKGLVAHAIHELSPRAEGPFIDLNCSAIPETLIEAELFGHQRGAFTGAHENRSGLFEKASGGTLFLDEVDALNPSAQAKLLRVLQERTVRRIGARANIAIDVRIISATNIDLAKAVAEGRFRPDLYYRLRVLPLHLPQLKERAGDIELLVTYFLKRYAARYGMAPQRFSDEAMRALLRYDWPGNVRELENTIEYALAISTGPELTIVDLPPEVMRETGSDPRDFAFVLDQSELGEMPLAEIERRYILHVLKQFGGNQAKTAKALGIDLRAVRFIKEQQLKTG